VDRGALYPSVNASGDADAHGEAATFAAAFGGPGAHPDDSGVSEPSIGATAVERPGPASAPHARGIGRGRLALIAWVPQSAVAESFDSRSRF
jgi:hypothetical protein